MPDCNPEFVLPPWIKEFTAGNCSTLLSVKDRMNLVIELARQNTLHKTGGPFGAAVFERYSGRLVAVGVNLVVRSNCSNNHAEMVALGVAEHRLARYSLSSPDLPDHELVTSSEPCAMCFGAIIWSGIRRLVCGAYTSDAESAGFDEGPKPEKWIEELEKRGVEVVTGVERHKARSVISHYIAERGILYNGHPRQ
jgi:tRNA(Arg) A34 adenosine deaminase TadA